MYLSVNSENKSFEWERQSKSIRFHLPIQYNGEFSDSTKFDIKQSSDDKIWIVNGYCEIFDGSFKQPFEITQIADTSVSISPYPITEQDVHKMREAGISGILNLMGIEEMAQANFNSHEMISLFE